MPLRVGPMVPEEISKERKGQVIIASVGAVEEGQQSDSQEVVAKHLLLLHQLT